MHGEPQPIFLMIYKCVSSWDHYGDDCANPSVLCSETEVSTFLKIELFNGAFFSFLAAESVLLVFKPVGVCLWH